MIKAVIFDVDGVIIDSERFYYNLNKNYLLSQGFHPSDEQLHSFIGISMDELYRRILDFFPFGTMTMSRLRKEYDAYCALYPLKFKDVMFPEVPELVSWLHQQGIETAIASSSSIVYLRKMLTECGLADSFDVVISGENFKNNKPDPEVYNNAIANLKLEPKQCLVVEDSMVGIKAGKTAGCQVVGYENFGNQDYSQADYKINKLQEIEKLITDLNKPEVQPIRINYQDKELVLIPVAHVSKNSAQLVREVIEQENPDSICVELDEDRYNSFQNKKKWEDTSIVSVIKENKVGYFLVNLLLASYQRRLASHLNSNSGQEMLEGIKAAKERNIPLVLADRSVQTTFTRIWRKMSAVNKIKLLSSSISSIFDNEEFSEEDIAKLEQKDELQAALKELQDQFPEIATVLVEERDQYLAYKVKSAPGKKVVAVLGAAHTIGMQKWIFEDYSIEELTKLPPKGKLGKTILWTLSAILVLLVVLTFTKNPALGFRQILNWIFWHGGLSALGCLLCLAHPLTILVGFLAAPISALSPLLASGWFAGLTEASLRKPTVKDFEALPNDVSSFKGFWHNKVTKILMVVILSNIGSTLGSLIGGIDIISKFLQVFK